jgi:PAT family beta-lactamase induction signal transducer AmpG
MVDVVLPQRHGHDAKKELQGRAANRDNGPVVAGRWRDAVAVWQDRRILAIGALGFASGLPLALTFSTLSFWLKEEGLSNTAIGLFASVSTPYTLKFLWAPLVDRVRLPLLGRMLGRRRSWLFASQLALIATIVALGSSHPAVDPWTTAVLAVVVAFCSATQDIVIDAFRVESLDAPQYAAGAAAIVFGYRIGMLASGAGALVLAEKESWAAVYAVMALLMLVGVVTTLLVAEPASGAPVAGERRHALPGLPPALARLVGWMREAVVSPFADFMSRQRWATILLFVMLYKLGDALAGVMTNPFLLELGFTKSEIATVVKTYGLAATLVGAAAGGSLLGSVGMMRSLWICGVLQMLSNLTFAVQAHVGHSVPLLTLTIGLENLAGGMGTAAFVAYLSSLCNVAYTATQYALLTSLMSAARTWLSSGAGYVADSTEWTTFYVLTTLAAVPGLLLLKRVAAATQSASSSGAASPSGAGGAASPVAAATSKDETK